MAPISLLCGSSRQSFDFNVQSRDIRLSSWMTGKSAEEVLQVGGQSMQAFEVTSVGCNPPSPSSFKRCNDEIKRKVQKDAYDLTVFKALLKKASKRPALATNPTQPDISAVQLQGTSKQNNSGFDDLPRSFPQALSTQSFPCYDSPTVYAAANIVTAVEPIVSDVRAGQQLSGQLEPKESVIATQTTVQPVLTSVSHAVSEATDDEQVSAKFVVEAELDTYSELEELPPLPVYRPLSSLNRFETGAMPHTRPEEAFFDPPTAFLDTTRGNRALVSQRTEHDDTYTGTCRLSANELEQQFYSSLSILDSVEEQLSIAESLAARQLIEQQQRQAILALIQQEREVALQAQAAQEMQLMQAVELLEAQRQAQLKEMTSVLLAGQQELEASRRAAEAEIRAQEHARAESEALERERLEREQAELERQRAWLMSLQLERSWEERLKLSREWAWLEKEREEREQERRAQDLQREAIQRERERVLKEGAHLAQVAYHERTELESWQSETEQKLAAQVASAFASKEEEQRSNKKDACCQAEVLIEDMSKDADSKAACEVPNEDLSSTDQCERDNDDLLKEVEAQKKLLQQIEKEKRRESIKLQRRDLEAELERITSEVALAGNSLPSEGHPMPVEVSRDQPVLDLTEAPIEDESMIVLQTQIDLQKVLLRRAQEDRRRRQKARARQELEAELEKMASKVLEAFELEQEESLPSRQTLCVQDAAPIRPEESGREGSDTSRIDLKPDANPPRMDPIPDANQKTEEDTSLETLKTQLEAQRLMLRQLQEQHHSREVERLKHELANVSKEVSTLQTQLQVRPTIEVSSSPSSVATESVAVDEPTGPVIADVVTTVLQDQLEDFVDIVSAQARSSCHEEDDVGSQRNDSLNRSQLADVITDLILGELIRESVQPSNSSASGPSSREVSTEEVPEVANPENHDAVDHLTEVILLQLLDEIMLEVWHEGRNTAVRIGKAKKSLQQVSRSSTSTA